MITGEATPRIVTDRDQGPRTAAREFSFQGAPWQVTAARVDVLIGVLAVCAFQVVPLGFAGGSHAALKTAAILTSTVAVAAFVLPRTIMTIGVLSVWLGWCALRLPETSNTEFLLLWALAFLALAERRRSSTTALSGLRWIPIVVLMYSGLSKWLFGAYDQGEYLAMAAARGAVGGLPEWMIPSDELSRLRGLLAGDEPSMGPFRFQALVPLTVSHLLPVVEIAAGAALLLQRLEKWSWVGALAATAVMSAIWRNFVFGYVLICLIAQFAPSQRTCEFIRRAALLVFALLGALRAFGLLQWNP